LALIPSFHFDSFNITIHYFKLRKDITNGHILFLYLSRIFYYHVSRCHQQFTVATYKQICRNRYISNYLGSYVYSTSNTYGFPGATISETCNVTFAYAKNTTNYQLGVCIDELKYELVNQKYHLVVSSQVFGTTALFFTIQSSQAQYINRLKLRYLYVLNLVQLPKFYIYQFKISITPNFLLSSTNPYTVNFAGVMPL
jgi:hypothetical protein